jgi:molybdenum transport protein
MYITDSVLDQFIEEDVPYIDFTSEVVGIGDQNATIEYRTREETCVCGSEEVKRILNKLNIEVLFFEKSGTFLQKGSVILKAKGKASDIHMAWKVCVNILENASGIATRTKKFVDIAKSQNQNVEVITTRKNFPGTKRLAIKAITAGGALPHRLGLSETLLVFQEHLKFIGGIDAFVKNIDTIKKRAGEKKLIVEAHNMENAITLAKAGVEVIQLDKFGIEEIKQTVKEIRKISKLIKIGAAGGVNLENVKEIASTGVDLLTTSSLYFGKPSDIKADIQMV